jgi:hypothetical protein
LTGQPFAYENKKIVVVKTTTIGITLGARRGIAFVRQERRDPPFRDAAAKNVSRA